MLLRRKAGTFLSILGASAIAAGLGGAAIAGPGAPPVELKPTAELSSSGGVAAPGASAPTGGVEAPAVEPAPAPVEPAPPVEAAPVPTTETVPAPTETPTAEEVPAAPEETPDAVTPQAEPEPSEIEPAPASGEPVVEEPAVPTSAEVLGTDNRPLVPVAVLSAPVESASEGDPLVTMAEPDAEVRAIAAQEEGEGGEDEVQEDDEDEIIIPIDPNGGTPEEDEDTTPDTDGGDTVPGIHVPARSRAGDELALTGVELKGPLGAGLVFLIVGGFLRITAPPTFSPARV
jgi:hypothetical protein